MLYVVCLYVVLYVVCCVLYDICYMFCSMYSLLYDMFCVLPMPVSMSVSVSAYIRKEGDTTDTLVQQIFAVYILLCFVFIPFNPLKTITVFLILVPFVLGSYSSVSQKKLRMFTITPQFSPIFHAQKNLVILG